MEVARTVVVAGSALAAVIAAHTVVNLRRLPSPSGSPVPLTEPVSVLIPARDEAEHLAATVESVLAQNGLDDLEVVVLDDASTDGTAELADRLAARDPRMRVVHADTDPPAGWLGKPWACARLADQARGAVLVFVDADVELAPDAVQAAVALLREHDLALVAPYPRQIAGSWLERLTQPLVTWAPLALLPLRWQQHSTRPSLSAANGQFLVLDASAYQAVGGHHAVRDRVVEDVALMAALRRNGFAAWTVDGSRLAHCRMYDSAPAVVDGYAKSLWAAFGGPAGSIAVTGTLLLAYVVPATALLAARDRRTRVVGALGYAAGVTSRALVARRTGEPVVDALAQPASVLAFAALGATSWWRRGRGSNTWKGRSVVAA